MQTMYSGNYKTVHAQQIFKMAAGMGMFRSFSTFCGSLFSRAAAVGCVASKEATSKGLYSSLSSTGTKVSALIGRSLSLSFDWKETVS